MDRKTISDYRDNTYIVYISWHVKYTTLNAWISPYSNLEYNELKLATIGGSLAVL